MRALKVLVECGGAIQKCIIYYQRGKERNFNTSHKRKRMIILDIVMSKRLQSIEYHQ
jgi:hypothetical protein